MKSNDEVGARAAAMLSNARREWARLRTLVRYAAGFARQPWTPPDADAEYRDLARKCQTPWAGLAIRSKTQGLTADGHTSARVWREIWLRNAMPARQDAILRDAATTGYSWLIGGLSDAEEYVIEPCSSTRGYASWADSWLFEMYPIEFLRLVRDSKGDEGKGQLWQYIDAEARWTIEGNPAKRHRVVAVDEHPFGVCPVSMIPNDGGLDGMPVGEIEPLTRTLDRISDATFALQVNQRYGAFPQKWASGWPEARIDANGDEVEPEINANVDSLITTDIPEGRFGNFAATDLRQVIEAQETHIRHLLSVAQVPPYYLIGGSLANTSEQLIYATEMGRRRKIIDAQELMTDRFGAILDLGAEWIGDTDGLDPEARVMWRAVDIYPLPVAADAFSKMRAGGMSPERALSYMPGMSADDIAAEAALIRATDDPGAPTGDTAGDAVRAVQGQATALGILIRAGVEPAEAAERVGLGQIEFSGAMPTSLRLPEREAAALEEK